MEAGLFWLAWSPGSRRRLDTGQEYMDDDDSEGEDSEGLDVDGILDEMDLDEIARLDEAVDRATWRFLFCVWCFFVKAAHHFRSATRIKQTRQRSLESKSLKRRRACSLQSRATYWIGWVASRRRPISVRTGCCRLNLQVARRDDLLRSCLRQFLVSEGGRTRAKRMLARILGLASVAGGLPPALPCTWALRLCSMLSLTPFSMGVYLQGRDHR